MPRATPALNGAVLLGVTFAFLGLFTRSQEALLGAVPFLVYVCWGLTAKPSCQAPSRADKGELTLIEGRPTVLETHVETPLPLVTVQWPVSGMGWMSPAYGTVTTVGGQEPVSVTAMRWGSYRLGPAVVVQSDVLGAWRVVSHTRPLTARVRPETPTMVGPSGVRNPQGLSGAHTSPRPGEGSNLAEIRPYRPGDRLRRINWRVTAREGSLHVSQTLTERDTTVYVVLDSVEEVANADEVPLTSLDLGISAATAIMHHYLGLGDRVALLDLGAAFPTLPPASGAGQVRRAMTLLAQIDREGMHRRSLRTLREVTSHSLVFLCSPMVGRRTPDEAARLTALGAQVVVVDCLPTATLGSRTTTGLDEPVAEAIALLRMARQARLDGLARLGVPVVAWAGPTSLAGVLSALERTRCVGRRHP